MPGSTGWYVSMCWYDWKWNLTTYVYSHWPVLGHDTVRFTEFYSASGMGVWERLGEGWSGPSVAIAQGTKSSLTLYSPQTHTPYTSPFNSLSLSLGICLTLFLDFFFSQVSFHVFSVSFIWSFFTVSLTLTAPCPTSAHVGKVVDWQTCHLMPRTKCLSAQVKWLQRQS